MASIVLGGFVILVFTSECLAGLNVLKALSNTQTWLRNHYKTTFCYLGITSPLQKLTNRHKDFMQIVSEHGYHAEKHQVTTEDGYILTIFRIPPRHHCTKKAPMLMMHGLLQAAEAFIDIGPEAPGIVLAEECYDLWFGNDRGTYHSRKHVSLDPDKDVEYWKFSVDEIGLYDIPAIIDHVLTATDTKKLIYVGFSQGGGSFCIMNSERPEYADKVSLFVGLAPASRHYHTKSELFRSVADIINVFQAPLEAIGVWEVLSQGMPIQGALGSLCQVELLAVFVCSLLLTLVDSPHPDSVTTEIEQKLLQHAPAGTSIQNFARYGQAMHSLKYVKFDYGTEGNSKVYGTFEPPEYNLKAVNMPTVIFHGLSDQLVDPRDVDWLVKQLPNVLDYVKIEDPLWNHLDMTYSRFWKKTIYVTMKKYLNRYDHIY